MIAYQRCCKYQSHKYKYKYKYYTRKPCYRKDDRAMRPIYGSPEKFRESSQTPPATFPEICKVLLFRSILRMCIQNLKFVALSVPEIQKSTQKIWAVPRYAHAPFSLKFLKGFCSDGPCEIPAKFEVCSFTRSWDNRGCSKKLGSPWIRPHSLFSQILRGFCLDGPFEYTCQIWTL